jgi:multidrug efflux pump subunit AcrA (membrane-fusion protein)
VNDASNRSWAGKQSGRTVRRSPAKLWVGAGIAIAAAGVAWLAYSQWEGEVAGHPPPPAPPQVVVSKPLERELDAQLGFLGQFSAVDQVELRAQVGGTLTEIHFKDGDIVHKGELLFVIDPVPYEIRLAQATAQLESATARLELANREFARAQALKRTDAGTAQNVDRRTARISGPPKRPWTTPRRRSATLGSIWTTAASRHLSPGASARIWSPSAT